MDKAQLKEFLVASLKSVTTDGQRINETSEILLKALEPSNINKYLKVKCVVEASRESILLDGLVFRKLPVHDEMSKEVTVPIICLFKGYLELEKEANVDIDSSTMSILDESNQVIVLVEKAISQYDGYEEYFLKRNITAIQNMGHRLLRFPTENTSSTCKSFKCGEKMKDLTTDMTLMHFQGCESLTIMLKGSDINELKQVKWLLKREFNILRNRQTKSECFLATLPRPFNFHRMNTDALNEETALGGLSNYIADLLRSQTDKASFSLHEHAFSELRRKCGYSETDYTASLSNCGQWDAQGGKSGAYFARSIDQRLIIKEIKKDEFHHFSTTVGDNYFKYLSSTEKTSLAKLFGVYQVLSGKPKFVIVMENLSFNRKLVAQYDLKGSTKGRLAPTTAGVLLDENFSNDMKIWPYVISRNSKKSFEVALRNDTEFLSSVGVMDYSLFIGVDQSSHELICGIIDYLGPYDWKKALESAVKSTIGCCVQPTVIDPEGYKTRFMEFMLKEFQLDGK